MKVPKVLYLGIGRHVLAVDRVSGNEIWRRKLPSGTLLTLLVERYAIYAGAAGELFCLDPRTGEIRWQNPLKGLTQGIITFGDSSAGSAAAINAAATNLTLTAAAVGTGAAVTG